MLFLMNDRVLDLDLRAFDQPLEPSRFHGVSVSFVVKLGQELFAEHPLMHREQAERARRLALLITAKSPEVNAALFVAPSYGCRPDEVVTRFAALDVGVMAELYRQDQNDTLTPVAADREVWRRMAA